MNYAAAFSRMATAFGVYADATVIENTPISMDAGGSVMASVAAISRPCRAQIDAATEAMRSAEGYQDQDVRLLVIDLAGPLVSGMRVLTDGSRYIVQSATRDPAAIGWECRARPA